MTERLINRRQQGDLGEASAIEWLTSKGATVFVPLGHSPDVDLIADMGGRQLRIQVKTSTQRNGSGYRAMIATNGGNQSWNGLTKYFDPSRCDALFVLIGDGRRWLIPSKDVKGRRNINLGGLKYAEFEVEPGMPIEELVYGGSSATVESIDARGSAGVWRAGPACKAGALALSEFESHLPHSESASEPEALAVGRTRVSSNHQVTIPKGPFVAAGLAIGDPMRVEAREDGTVVVARIEARKPAFAPR